MVKNQENNDTDVPEIPSKSQLKREAKALFNLGRELAALPPAQLDTLPLESSLKEAIAEARGIRSNVARKRQLGFVAKLLRHVDADPLWEAMQARDNDAHVDTGRLHRAETWRDELIAAGDPLLAALVRMRPEADAQMLRQLIRNARREASLGKPPASARKLFRMLRSLDEQSALPALPDPAG